ncbi:MAG: CPXCG motif-containing cysteine-rich protein [Candidatus Sumerlaeia bacterium]
MIIDAEFRCAYCGEVNATTVDLSAGTGQEYVEDCQVCCRPNELRVEIDPENMEARIEVEEES